MEKFFTSTQIYNPNLLAQEHFIRFFCEEMKKSGYVISNSDESEVSYILRFSDECKWVTLTSEAYEQGNQLSQADTGRIVKTLKRVCINTTVIDSDCATLDLYDKSGRKKDSLIIGRTDDYFGDDIPEPIESVWTPLLEKGYSWKQLLDVRNGDYVFVEEGLTEIAPVIGMDSEGVLFSVDDDIDSKHTESLYFRKITAKKEQKLTVNAAFKQIYGSALEPLGFVKARTKIPYFVRAINDEIIHVVSIRSHGSALSVVSGVATVYRKELDFNKIQRYDEVWLHSNADYYLNSHRYDSDRRQEAKLRWYGFQPKASDDMLKAMLQSLEDMKIWALPILNSICTSDSMMEYLLSMGGYVFPAFFERSNPEDGYPCSDGAFMLTLNNPLIFLEREKELGLQQALFEYEHHVYGITQTEEQYVRTRGLICNQYDKSVIALSLMLNDPDNRKKLLKKFSNVKAEI